MLTKKPSKSPTKETKAQKFIRAGSSPAPAAAAAAENGRRELKPVVINFTLPLLERIDQAAAAMGLNRTAFVISAVSERVMRVERGE